MLPMCWLTAWLTMSTQGAPFLFQHLCVYEKFLQNTQSSNIRYSSWSWGLARPLSVPFLILEISQPSRLGQAWLKSLFLTTPQLLSGNSYRQYFFLPPPNFYQAILIAKFFFYFFYHPPTFIRQFLSPSFFFIFFTSPQLLSGNSSLPNTPRLRQSLTRRRKSRVSSDQAR